MIKKIKNWLRKRRKWDTKSNYVADYKAMKQALLDNNKIIIKSRMSGKKTILDDIIKELEEKSGTKIENWQKNLIYNRIKRDIPGTQKETKPLEMYRSLKTGDITFKDQKISERDIINNSVEIYYDDAKEFKEIFGNEIKWIDNNILKSIEKQKRNRDFEVEYQADYRSEEN